MCNTHFAYYSQGRHKPTNYDKYFPIKYFQREKWGRTGLVEHSLRKTWLVTWVRDIEVVCVLPFTFICLIKWQPSWEQLLEFPKFWRQKVKISDEKWLQKLNIKHEIKYKLYVGTETHSVTGRRPHHLIILEQHYSLWDSTTVLP